MTSGSPPVRSISPIDQSFSREASSFFWTADQTLPLWRAVFFSKRDFNVWRSCSRSVAANAFAVFAFVDFGMETCLAAEAGHEAHESGLREFLAFEFAHLNAFAEDDDAAGKVHEFRKFGGDQEDGGALAGELIEQLVDFALCADVDAASRFV